MKTPLITKQNLIYAGIVLVFAACFALDVVFGICVLVLSALGYFWVSNNFSLEPDMPPRPGPKQGNSRGKMG